MSANPVKELIKPHIPEPIPFTDVGSISATRGQVSGPIPINKFPSMKNF